MEKPKQTISPAFIDEVCARLSRNEPVRRKLPPWGRLHIDRRLPFLCVYRRPRGGADAGTEKLTHGEASYLMASGQRSAQKGLQSLVHGIAETLIGSLGAFLIVELWVSPDTGGEDVGRGEERGPGFRIHPPREEISSTSVRVLEQALKGIRLGKKRADVEVRPPGKTSPPGLPEILPARTGGLTGHAVIGLEIEPVYRDVTTGQLYPLVLRRLHRQLARALKKTFYEFSRSQTTLHPSHFLSLGRRTMVKAVWEVDRQLAQVGDSFDFLLYVTPTNADSAWAAFRRTRYDTAPKFTYRPLPVDPALLKRQLFAIPVERIEGPVIAQLFREKQEELDRKISMLGDRGGRRFLWGSLLLYGGGDDDTLKTARNLLTRIPPHSRDGSAGGYADADIVTRHAEAEIAHFRSLYPEVTSQVEVRSDVSGLMVSRNRLLIGKSIKVPMARVHALVQHEVGTHLLTYINGKSQPFQQLRSGLAGYEELQEGFAVLAEYLAGGLSRPRLRLLAARVVATRSLIDGASFVDTFRELNREFGFEQRTAFMIAARVYRSGGLTKDAVYLKGFLSLIQYLKKGGELEPLFVGKIGMPHVPTVKELQLRGVLHAPPLRPRYLADPEFPARMAALMNSKSVHEMVAGRKRHAHRIHG